MRHRDEEEVPMTILRWMPTFSERLPAVELPDQENSEAMIDLGLPVGEFRRIQQFLSDGKSMVLVAESKGCAIAEAALSSLGAEARAGFYFRYKQLRNQGGLCFYHKPANL